MIPSARQSLEGSPRIKAASRHAKLRDQTAIKYFHIATASERPKTAGHVGETRRSTGDANWLEGGEVDRERVRLLRALAGA